ncbi:putative membrane protein [Wickerhamomyces ciferrii]|uniref:Membrane protein n=1 Tax=Wickerhamomyces ciferrii (strain ATCC 14091 / BCRC 22168 / CBS 111 / JCM 3599 / NBRC 0793 / NRRL Y-1031 F-60-10) TaxID=1206466 RepID=K0KFT5_WICCF|nr:uncharacterized protein BN7_629 [Wickerhamomyces ciferrii]CCH41092.1 putative membrane protein [Wickerhamomyces ciferrii]
MSTEHDQATVSSPTDQYHSEKFPQQQQPVTKKSTRGGILGKIGSNPLITYGLRAAQFIFSIVSLALASRSLNKFYNGERRMRFTSFVGGLTLAYLILLGFISFIKPSFLMSGPIMIMELLLTIFWLCAFISTAARYSQFSCKVRRQSSYGSSGYGSGSGYGNTGGSGYGNYASYPSYGNSTHIKGCRSGKAAVAFSAFCFLLFALSSALLYYNVIRRLLANKKRNSFFQTGAQSGVRLNKPALAFSRHYNVDSDNEGDSIGRKYSSHDVESGAGDTHTYTNEHNDGVTRGGYNTRAGNESNYGDNYGNTYGNNQSGNTNYNQQTTEGYSGQYGSKISYPETSYQSRAT